jgi:hypothetical protein
VLLAQAPIPSGVDGGDSTNCLKQP